MSLPRRVAVLEKAARAETEGWFSEALHALAATMAPEHLRVVSEWQQRPDVRADFRAHPRDPWPAREARLAPPALVRAAWRLLIRHLERGTPVALPPAVAQIYLDDPDAWPCNECTGCGYLAPVRIRWTRSGRPEVVLTYLEECPACDADAAEPTTAPAI